MLRWTVLALLALNLLFFGWTRGWLDGLTGLPARGDREPQRLAQQVHPERITLTAPGAAAEASAAASGSAPVAAAVSAPVPAISAAAGAAPVTGSASAPAPTGPAAVASAPASPVVGVAAVAGRAPGPAAAASATSEPARLAAAASPPAASAPPVCLETGPYPPGDLSAVITEVRAALPEGSWAERKETTGEWMIYMGPYPDRETLERKKRELSRIRGGVPQEELQSPPELARGISLGRFPSQAAAAATLAQYNTRGVRTARVVRSGNGGGTVTYLRIAEADPALASRASALKLTSAARTFTPCPR
jgi:hypothetical protein